LSDWMFYKPEVKKTFRDTRWYTILLTAILLLIVGYGGSEVLRLSAKQNVLAEVFQFPVCYNTIYIVTDYRTQNIILVKTDSGTVQPNQGFHFSCEDRVYSVTAERIAIYKNNKLIGFAEVGNRLPLYFCSQLRGSDERAYWRLYENIIKILE